MIRTVPTTVNDAVDIGSFSFSNGGGALWISLIVPSSGFSVSKSYVIPINYSQTGGVWQQVSTTNTTSNYSGNDVELDIMVSGGTASLRIRRSGGSTAGTAYVAIRQDGVNTDSFSPSSAVTSVTAPTTILFAPVNTNWSLSGNVIASAWNGSSGNYVGSTSAFPLVIATTNATAQDIRFFTGASGANERMRISSTGNIGIGVTSPGVALDINGEIRTTNARTQSLSRTIPTTVNDAVDIGSFALSNGAGVIWMSISVPSSGFSIAKSYSIPLQFNQTAGVWQQVQSLNTTPSFGPSDVELDVMVSSGTASFRIRRSGGNTAGTAVVAIRQEGDNTNVFTPSSAVTSVSAPSTIMYSASSVGWLLNGSNTSTAWNGYVGNYLGTSSSQPLVIATTNASAQDIRFYTGASGVNERMRLTSTGNLGIGTTSPSAPLEVGTTKNVGDALFAIGNPQQYNQFVVKDRSATTALYGVTAGGLQVGITNYTNSIWSAQNVNNRIDYWDTTSNMSISSGTGGDIILSPGSAVSIKNTNNAAREIRFYEPSSSGSNYSALKAGVQSADISYTLPTAAPVANNYAMTATTAGAMSWTDPTTMVGGTKIVYKSADESYSTGTSVQDDDNLTLNIGANEVWQYEWYLHTTGSTSGIKFAVTIPSGATMKTGVHMDNTSSNDEYELLTTSGTETTTNFENIDNGTAFVIRSLVVNSSTAGTVKLQWGRYNAAGTVTVRSHSYLKASRVQ